LLCGLLAIGIQKLSKPMAVESGSKARDNFVGKDHWWSKAWDSFWIIGGVLLVIPPLMMVFVSGLNTQLWSVVSDWRFWQALATSLQVAVMAAMMALLLGFAILLTSRGWRMQLKNSRASLLELVGTIILVTPGLVISTGIFLLLRSVADVYSLAFWVVVCVNALMALPYV
ncbi:thiamine/thiamine pyrophosphate ABC transporter permease ThiP, partial [Vibrio campbellii]